MSFYHFSGKCERRALSHPLFEAVPQASLRYAMGASVKEERFHTPYLRQYPKQAWDMQWEQGRRNMKFIKKSPWILHYDGSSCNGCDIEVLACLTPLYDVERFGVINTGNPKHADILLITGSVNEQNIPVVKQLYEQMANPKAVVAVGICATSGGIFAECYNVIGGVDKVLPVDVYVPGCAARPEAIIDGIVKALAILEEKQNDARKSFTLRKESGLLWNSK